MLHSVYLVVFECTMCEWLKQSLTMDRLFKNRQMHNVIAPWDAQF